MRADITENGRGASEAADHASDADLLRILDREAPLSPLDDTTAHVSACADCAARAELLRHRRVRLAALLAADDVPVPALPRADEMLARARARRRTRARPVLRAAALLVVAGALAAQPAVRHWVGARWERITSRASNAPPPATPRGYEGQARGSVLAFDAGAGPLTIRYDVRPVGGSLIIESDTGPLVRAEQIAGANLELLVARQGLHVRNAVQGAPPSFVVRVPRTIRSVELRYGAAARPDTTFELVEGTRNIINFH